MSRWQNISVGSMILIGLSGIMCLTNPGQQSYQEYADETLKTHLKEKVCVEAAPKLGQWLQSQCYNLIDTASPHLAQIIAQQTTRTNFILFSIYRTDLSTPDPLPDYHLETIGLLGNFYTYQADEL
ncbi:MAG: DUF4359 domain-containing protein [Pleurocapsa sp.]